MNQATIKEGTTQVKVKGQLNSFAHLVSQKINDLFKPEEVEVTIEGTGYNRTYTVTKPTNR